MLKLESVTGGYGGKVVLNGVTLSVFKNEIVGLVGPNGSGKSTVLKSIFGMVQVSDGKILYNNTPIQNQRPSVNAKAGICYIPQGSKVFDKLTVQDNLELGGVSINDRKLLHERIKQMYIDFPVLKQFQNTLAGKLSGGQRQMVGFCRGLIMHPDFILVDEPSIGLAPSLVKQTIDLIRGLRDNYNTTVLIVEQNVRALLEIADRVYLLSSGKIVHEEEYVDQDTESRLRELFLK